MTLQSGTRLGPYEVTAALAGEPGERYAATDTRANRVVTIRLLPPDSPIPEGARTLLEKNAKTLSSLRHPHIGVPIEIGHQDPSTDFVVSEHVEGESLAGRLAGGPMELQEALQVTIAIADSLDKAHRLGIVHGGLNPSTVVLTSAGPTLLDFGLARLLEPSPAVGGREASGMATMATTRLSRSLTGLPASVASYMAPEQYAGAPLDARTDIFALGTLLYEMVTGRPAFQEKTPALLVAAIQSVEPEPVSKLQPMAPASLDHLVARCLRKDPRERLQTSWDLLVQLRWIAEGGSRVGVPAPVAARRKTQDRIVWAAGAAAVVVTAALAPFAVSSFREAPGRPAMRFTVAGLPSTNSGVPISVSPDGRWVIGSPGGGAGVFGVTLDSVTPQRLVQRNVVTQPFWSPDSRSIAFFENGLLKRIEIAGGPAQTIAEAPAPIANGTWNQDGVILFSSGGVIHRVLAAGGESTPVTGVDEKGEPIAGEEHIGPWFLPDGRHFLYAAVSSESAIFLAELDSPGRTRLVNADSKPMYAEPGYILFNRGPTLFAQPFDAGALALTGEPIRVTDGVAMLLGSPITTTSLTRSANFSVSQTGVLVFKGTGTAAPLATGAAAAVTPGVQRQLVWIDSRPPSNVPVEQVATGGFAGVDVAPDGARFAAHLHEGNGGDIWVFDPDQRRMQRFTFDAGQENSSPVWSPDGTRIAFASRRNDRWGLYVKSADGAGAEELVIDSAEQKAPMSWSPDGKLLVYAQIGQGPDIWAVPLEGEKKPIEVLVTGFAELLPHVSPDGRWMAYQSNETGQFEIYIKQFPEGPAKRQVSTTGGLYPNWRGDGKELYFTTVGTGLQAVEIDTTGPSPRPGVPRPLFGMGNPNMDGHFGLYRRVAVSPDGRRFLLSQPGTAAALGGGGADSTLRRLADGGPVGSDADVAVNVMLSWPQMLRGR